MAPTITHPSVDGVLAPQVWGQLKVVIRDMRFTSGDANDAGDFVVTPESIGLTEIFGVIDLSVYAGADADIPRSIGYVPATDTLTFYAADRAALDLDSTDFAEARLAFLGI